MLHFNAIKSDALVILKKLMDLPALVDFNLAGGTALSLNKSSEICYAHKATIIMG